MSNPPKRAWWYGRKKPAKANVVIRSAKRKAGRRPKRGRD